MPHRRRVAPYKKQNVPLTYNVPEDITRTTCSGCGEPYAPKPVMSIEQSMELPREDRRAEP
jgi:hypothetical protein